MTRYRVKVTTLPGGGFEISVTRAGVVERCVTNRQRATRADALSVAEQLAKDYGGAEIDDQTVADKGKP